MIAENLYHHFKGPESYLIFDWLFLPFKYAVLVILSEWDMWMTHIGSWIDFYTFWIRDFKGPAHIIYYNNLKVNTVQELSHAIDFLGLKPDYYRMNCTIFYPKPSYFKRSHAKAPVEKYDLFRLSMSKADRAIREFTQLVENRFGANSELYQRRNLEISEQKLRE